MHKRRIMSSVANSAVPNLSTSSHKRHDFRKKLIEHKMCVLIFSTKFVRKVYCSKKNSAIYYHTCALVFMWSTRYSCQTFMKLEFSGQIFEKSSNTKCNKNPPILRAELFHVHRHTDGDTTKLIVDFRNFANAPICWHTFWQCLLINNSISPFLISLELAVVLSFPSPKDLC